MNVPTVLEQPALPVELSATLELAADFAKASKAPATQGGLWERLSEKGGLWERLSE